MVYKLFVTEYGGEPHPAVDGWNLNGDSDYFYNDWDLNASKIYSYYLWRKIGFYGGALFCLFIRY